MLRPVGLCGLGRLVAFAEAENIGNDVACARSETFRFHPKGNLDVWLTLRIWVVFWIFAKSLLTTG